MRKYGESKTTRIMMATVPHVTSGLGLRKFQADGFLVARVYNCNVMAVDAADTRELRIPSEHQNVVQNKLLFSIRPNGSS